VRLAYQIKKYIKYLEDHKVKRNYFPINEEVFLVLVEGKISKSEIPCVGKWTRCCRGSLNWLTELDTAKQFPMDPERSDKLKGVVTYSFRPCPKEFFSCVPIGVVPLDGHLTDTE